MIDFPQEIPAHIYTPLERQHILLDVGLESAEPTLVGTMLRAARGDKVQGHMRRSTNVFVRKGPIGALITSTHHTLADKASSAHHKHQEDDGNDWTDGVGGFIAGDKA